MAAPLLLLGLSGLSTVGFGVGLNKTAFDNEDLKPKWWGMDARPIAGGLGLLSLLFGGPMIAAIGMGALAASAVNYDTTKRTREGLEQIVQHHLKEISTAAPPPAAITETPASPVATAVPGGLLTNVLDLFT